MMNLFKTYSTGDEQESGTEERATFNDTKDTSKQPPKQTPTKTKESSTDAPFTDIEKSKIKDAVAVLREAYPNLYEKMYPELRETMDEKPTAPPMPMIPESETEVAPFFLTADAPFTLRFNVTLNGSMEDFSTRNAIYKNDFDDIYKKIYVREKESKQTYNPKTKTDISFEEFRKKYKLLVTDASVRSYSSTMPVPVLANIQGLGKTEYYNDINCTLSFIPNSNCTFSCPLKLCEQSCLFFKTLAASWCRLCAIVESKEHSNSILKSETEVRVPNNSKFNEVIKSMKESLHIVNIKPTETHYVYTREDYEKVINKLISFKKKIPMLDNLTVNFFRPYVEWNNKEELKVLKIMDGAKLIDLSERYYKKPGIISFLLELQFQLISVE